MNRFMYFLPGVSGCNNEMLAKRGLINRFVVPGGLAQFGINAWSEGPAGSGVAIALGSAPALYDKSVQVWENCGSFWLGMNCNEKPGPVDLQREVRFNGHEIELLDGNVWQVPLLRRWKHDTCEHVSALPKTLRPMRDANGKMIIVLAVLKQHEPLDALAETIWSAYVNNAVWDIEKLFRSAAGLMSENYRMDLDETGMLGILNEQLAMKIVGMAIDIPTIDASAELYESDGLIISEAS